MSRVFQKALDTSLPESLPINNTHNIDTAIHLLTEALLIAQQEAIPAYPTPPTRPYSISLATLLAIQILRALRRKYHRTKASGLKAEINKLNKETKSLLKQDADAYWTDFCSKLDDSTELKDF